MFKLFLLSKELIKAFKPATDNVPLPLINIVCLTVDKALGTSHLTFVTLKQDIVEMYVPGMKIHLTPDNNVRISDDVRTS